MTLSDRIDSLSQWGTQLALLSDDQKDSLFQKAENKNRWFTKSSCSLALQAILPWLKKATLSEWSGNYSIPKEDSNHTVGLVMAGNIPLVGFHDFLCVLISGNKAKVKLSSQDNELLPYLVEVLFRVDEHWRSQISFEERLYGVDAVIATGSDNSARYFEYYFRNIPKIIRKNRTSVGVIMGEEAADEIENLGRDVFTYFGMGCRNVSKIFIPEGFDLNLLKEPFNRYRQIIEHNKYANNYDYQKAIRLISSKPFIAFDHLLMEESNELVSPIAILYYQYYSNQLELAEHLTRQSEKIQSIVSANTWLKGSIPFGEAQKPKIDNYADGIDTLQFSLSIMQMPKRQLKNS